MARSTTAICAPHCADMSAASAGVRAVFASSLGTGFMAVIGLAPVNLMAQNKTIPWVARA